MTQLADRCRKHAMKSLPQIVRPLTFSDAPRASQIRICSQCGSIMQSMTATFDCADGTNLTLPLPVCVTCDPEHLKGSLKDWKLRSDMA